MHAWCFHVCVGSREAAGLAVGVGVVVGGWKCEGSTVYFNMSSCFQGIYALGKWLMLNKWSVTLEKLVKNMCSGVKSDRSHVFVHLAEACHRHVGRRAELLETATRRTFCMLPFVSQGETCETVIFPQRGCCRCVVTCLNMHLWFTATWFITKPN